MVEVSVSFIELFFSKHTDFVVPTCGREGVLEAFLCRIRSQKGQDWNPGKGKFRRRTGHEGPEGEYTYVCTLSLTSALDGVGWLT